MSEIVAICLNIIIGVAAVMAMLSLFNSAKALRAAERAHWLVVAQAQYDKELSDLMERIQQSRGLNARDLERAKEKIEDVMKELPSEQDRRFVKSGIDQPNAVGSTNYVTRILSPA